MQYKPKKVVEEKVVEEEEIKEIKVEVQPEIVKEKVIEPVTVIDGPIGRVLEFIENLPKGYIVTNVIKAPTSVRKNGPMVSLAFVEKSSNFKTVIVHSEQFEKAAQEANKEVAEGAIILHAYASPVSSRKRGRVAFGILIIMKKAI